MTTAVRHLLLGLMHCRSGATNGKRVVRSSRNFQPSGGQVSLSSDHRAVQSWTVELQAPVVQKVDSAIHRINLYPVDNPIGFPNTYPLDSDLSSG